MAATAGQPQISVGQPICIDDRPDRKAQVCADGLSNDNFHGNLFSEGATIPA
jgi:hypothetical protein